MGKPIYGFVRIVHTHGHTTAFKIKNVIGFGLTAVLGGEDHLEPSPFFNHKIRCPVLVPKRMAANTDGIFPGADKPWNIFCDNGFSENRSSENISDGSIGGSVHFFELKLIHPGFIRCNGCTFNPNSRFFYGI